MGFIEVGGARIELNEEGYLVHFLEWSQDVAAMLARTAEGLDQLTAEHWP